MTPMAKFRLWVLLGSILMVLLCRGFKDLAGPSAPEGSIPETSVTDRLLNDSPPPPTAGGH